MEDFIRGLIQTDPNWRPYCCRCDTMKRMEKTEYGYKCACCGNEINSDMTHHNSKDKEFPSVNG